MPIGSMGPMFTEDISRVVGTWEEVKSNILGCYCFTDAMKRECSVPLVEFGMRNG